VTTASGSAARGVFTLLWP